MMAVNRDSTLVRFGAFQMQKAWPDLLSRSAFSILRLLPTEAYWTTEHRTSKGEILVRSNGIIPGRGGLGGGNGGSGAT